MVEWGVWISQAKVRFFHSRHIKYAIIFQRVISSVGRTSALQAECRGFESHMYPHF